MHFWHIQTFSGLPLCLQKESCLMRHYGLSSCHIKIEAGRTPHNSPTGWFLSRTLSHFSSQSVVLSHSAIIPEAGFIDTFTLSVPIFLFRSMSLHLNVSVSLPLFPHNHLTPLRACAETSFTPQSSLWQQVLLALTAWPLSNQHLRGFIPLSSPPLFANLPLLFIFFCIHPLSPSVYPLHFPPHIIRPISSKYFAALPYFSKTWLVLNIMAKSPSICCPVCFSITNAFWRRRSDILLLCTCSCSTSLLFYPPVIVSAWSGCKRVWAI